MDLTMVPACAALLLLANLNIVAAAGSVGLTCAASGGECDTTIAGLYCDTAAGALTCKCADIYNAGTSGDTTCTGKTCTADSTCTAVDPNSVCVSGKCACATTFESSNDDDVKLCAAKVVESACTAGDCDAIPGAYCDSTTSKCKCGALYTAGTAGDSGTCVVTSCLTATPTTCTDLDSNSRCANLNCDCATGYDVYGSSSKCQSAGSGSVGLMASAFMLAVGVFFTILSF